MAYGSTSWTGVTPYDWLAKYSKSSPGTSFSWQVPSSEYNTPSARSPYTTFSDLASAQGWRPGMATTGVSWPASAGGVDGKTPVVAGGTVQAGGASAGNPFSSIRNVRIPAVQNMLDLAVGDWGTNRANAQTDLSNYRTESDASRTANRGYLNQENANIGEYYNGGIQSKLDKILSDRTAANAAITNRLMANASQADARRGLTSGAGPSSYRARILDDTSRQILENEANARAAQEQANLQWLSAAQQSLLGRRATGESAYLDTALNPLRATQASDAAMANIAGALTSAQLANNITGIYSPYVPLYGGSVPQVNYSLNMGGYPYNYGNQYRSYPAQTSTYPSQPGVNRTTPATGTLYPQNYGSLFPSNGSYSQNPFSGSGPWPNYTNEPSTVPDWIGNPVSTITPAAPAPTSTGVTRSWTVDPYYDPYDPWNWKT